MDVHFLLWKQSSLFRPTIFVITCGYKGIETYVLITIRAFESRPISTKNGIIDRWSVYKGIIFFRDLNSHIFIYIYICIKSNYKHDWNDCRRSIGNFVVEQKWPLRRLKIGRNTDPLAIPSPFATFLTASSFHPFEARREIRTADWSDGGEFDKRFRSRFECQQITCSPRLSDFRANSIPGIEGGKFPSYLCLLFKKKLKICRIIWIFWNFVDFKED